MSSPTKEASAVHPDAAQVPFLAARVDDLVSWGRSNSLWPFPFSTACCSIEFMGLMFSHYDFARFGSEFMRFTPRQADMLLITGTVTYKQAPILRRIWEQMAEPKWVVAVGACASSGGFYDCYCTVPGIDHIIPVDIYIAGCPPRPEAFIDAAMQLQEKVKDESFLQDRAARISEFKAKKV